MVLSRCWVYLRWCRETPFSFPGGVPRRGMESQCLGFLSFHECANINVGGYASSRFFVVVAQDGPRILNIEDRCLDRDLDHSS